MGGGVAKGHVRVGQFNTSQVALKLNRFEARREKGGFDLGIKEKRGLVKRSLQCAPS